MELFQTIHPRKAKMDDTTIAKDVLALLLAESDGLSDDMTALEPLIRERLFKIGAKALELHLDQQPLGYEGSSRTCPKCGENQKFVNYRPRTLATLMGQVTIKRAYYYCQDCDEGCCPYDQRIGLGTGHESVCLAKAATLVAALDPFIPATTLLYELTGQRLGDRTVHRVSRKVGSVASEREAKRALWMATWTIPIQGLQARPLRLYIAVDGVMVHRKQWNEAKCVTCYWDEPDGKGGTQRQSRYTVRFESAEQFKAFVWSLAAQCGLETAAEVILLGDGAAWIWEQVAGVLGEQVVCITDWYHVIEHLWACGNSLHGQGTEQASGWVKQNESLLWEGHYEKLLETLEQQRRQTRSASKQQALTELKTYLSNQGKRLAYDRFRAAGYDIGSGRVESACKHVVANRMKRSGMIWSDEGAQEILSLRTAYLNGQWDELWQTKPLRAQAA
jgi:hypothetical protein